MPPADLTPLDDREYRKLLLTLTLNSQQLDLLVAITDDRNLQDQLITAYEADLRDQGIAPLRARLDPKRPSLRATLEDLVTHTPALQAREPAVVTVLNAGELLGVRLSDEKSEQEKFFFSLQWTREALRNFAFPIVLWLPDAVATRLAQQAPDFWSWRGGVFEFVAEARGLVREGAVPMPTRDTDRESAGNPVATTDLQQQIAQLEQTTPESPLLITLYNNLGEAYARNYDYKQALEIYDQALALANAKQDPAGQARALRNLGEALRNCGRSFQALDYYQQALGKYRELGDLTGELNILNCLGAAYYLLGQYQQAIEYYQQSLAIAREIGNRLGEANALCNLGSAYSSLGQYRQAIEYQQQSLEIVREIGARQGEATSLGNLGNTYFSLGQYRQSIEYQQQQLEIAREIGDRNGEARSLGNLGTAYDALGEYWQAIEYYQQSLGIRREIGDHRGEAASLGGLGNAYFSLGQYRQVIEYYQQSLEIRREIGDSQGEAASLFNLGNALARVDEKWDARQAYETARALFADMGVAHNVEKCDQALYNLS